MVARYEDKTKLKIYENRKSPRKSNRIIDFLLLTSKKQMYEMNALKLNCFIILQNILFVKDCLSKSTPGSSKNKFRSSKLRLNSKTRSSTTYQLKVNNFKTERYGCKSIVRKFTLNRKTSKKY